MKYKYTSKFNKSLNNLLSRHPKIQSKIENTLNDFKVNLFNSKYYRKTFKYKNRKITELEFGGDYRILLELIIEKEFIYILNIGTYSSLELSSNKKLKI